MSFVCSYDKQKIVNAKRCQFILIFVVCFGILMYQIGQCVHKFTQANTATGDKYIHVSMTNFPELTICPAYPYDMERLRLHNVTRSGLQWHAMWVSNQPNISPNVFFEDVVLPLDEVVKSVDVFLESEVDGQSHFTFEGNATFCGESFYREKPYYYNGQCYAFVLPTCLHKAGTLELIFRFYNQTDIFIHHPGQFLNPNSR